MSIAGVFLIQRLEGSRFGTPTLWVLNGAESWFEGELIYGGPATGLGDRMVRSFAAKRQMRWAHVWPWCSVVRWSRDEKDRVIVVAQQGSAETVAEGQGN